VCSVSLLPSAFTFSGGNLVQKETVSAHHFSTDSFPMTRRTRIRILAIVSLGTIAAVFLHSPIPQSQGYHHFADRRALLGVPNCFDVLSNGIFLVIGVLGLRFLFRGGGAGAANSFTSRSERWPYVVFFIGVTLTSFGSAYYHLAPDNSRLVWDRLPMAIGFMAFLGAMIAERVSVKAGLGMLIPLVAVGLASVVYWGWSEHRGVGDLRLYLLVQFYSIVAIILLCVLFPPRYTGGTKLLGVVGLYGLAKVFELFDARVFAATGAVSGHTLKHLSAGLGVHFILDMLERRRPVADSAARL